MLKMLLVQKRDYWKHLLVFLVFIYFAVFAAIASANPTKVKTGHKNSNLNANKLRLVLPPNKVCGNGKVEPGESCDDGNNVDGDGCNSKCMTETCGDGIQNNAGLEECDDGNDVDNDKCTNDCKLAVCGDGKVNGDEECDDANLDEWDGCSLTCQIRFPCSDGTSFNAIFSLSFPPSDTPEWKDFGNEIFAPNDKLIDFMLLDSDHNLQSAHDIYDGLHVWSDSGVSFLELEDPPFIAPIGQLIHTEDSLLRLYFHSNTDNIVGMSRFSMGFCFIDPPLKCFNDSGSITYPSGPNEYVFNGMFYCWYFCYPSGQVQINVTELNFESNDHLIFYGRNNSAESWNTVLNITGTTTQLVTISYPLARACIYTDYISLGVNGTWQDMTVSFEYINDLI